MLKYGTLLCVLLISPQLYSADPVWIKNDGHGGPVDLIVPAGKTEIQLQELPKQKQAKRKSTSFFQFLKSTSTEEKTEEIDPKRNQLVRIWDPQKENVLQYYNGYVPVLVAPQYNRFLLQTVSSGKGITRLHDTETGKLLHEYSFDFAIADLFNNGKNFYLIDLFNDSDSGFPVINIYRTDNGNFLKSHQLPDVVEIAISPDGKHYVSIAKEDSRYAFYIRDLTNNNKKLRLENSEKEDSFFRAIDWSPNGKYILSELQRDRLGVWEADTGKHLHTTKVSHDIYTAEFSFDGKMILVGSGVPEKKLRKTPKGTVTLIESATGKILKEYPTREDFITQVSFSYDGHYAFASSSLIKGSYVWDISK